MSKGWLGFALLLVLITSASPVFAAIPPTINFQGYLVDSGGAPVPGPVNLTFSLFMETEVFVWTLMVALGVITLRKGKKLISEQPSR